MIALNDYDQNPLMIELDKTSMFEHPSFKSKVFPKIRTYVQRQSEEQRNPQLKIKDTGLTTLWSDEQIRILGMSPQS